MAARTPHEAASPRRTPAFPAWPRRVLELKRGEVALLLRMAVLAALLPLLRRFAPLPALLRRLAAGHGRAVTPERCMELATALLARRVAFLRPNCLTRSLLVFNLLRRAGHEVVVVFGVIRKQDGLAGHCWLEVAGAPLAEEGDPRQAFKVIYRYPQLPAGAAPEGAGVAGAEEEPVEAGPRRRFVAPAVRKEPELPDQGDPDPSGDDVG